MTNKSECLPPLDPELARQFDALDADAQEWFQERAGLIQYCSSPGISRREAEAAAWEETLLYLKRRNQPISPSD